MSDVFSDLENRYQDACARRQVVVEAWNLEGRPLLAAGSTGQLTEHPLMKQLNELDRLCDKLSQSLLSASKHRNSSTVMAEIRRSQPARPRDRSRDPRLDLVRAQR